MAGARTMVDRDAPAVRRGRQGLLRIRGTSGEIDLVSDGPVEAGRRRINLSRRGSVASLNLDRVGVRGPIGICHLEAHVGGPRRAVGTRWLRLGRIVELPVTIEVPGIGERVAVRVAGSGCVE